MPTLVTIRNPGTSREEQIQPSVTHDNSIASFTDIEKLLDGVSFNESLSELDGCSPSSEVMPASHSLVSTSSFNRSRAESFMEAKEASPDSEHLEDPDITTLEDDVVQDGDVSTLNDEDIKTLCDKENVLVSQSENSASTTQPKGVSMDSNECDTNIESTTRHNDPSRSNHDRIQQDKSSHLHSSDSHPIGCEREVFCHERRFKERFEQQVSTCISTFKQERPEVLDDYRNLSSERKIAAIQRSEKLVQRLRDSKSGTANFAKLASCGDSQQRANTTGLGSFCETQQSKKLSNLLSGESRLSPVANKCEVSLLANGTSVSLATNDVEGVDTTIEFEDANTSAALLSPFEQTPSRHKQQSKKYLEGMDEIEDLEDGSLSRDISKAYRSPLKSRPQYGKISPCTEITSHGRHGVDSPTAGTPSPRVTNDACNMSNYSHTDFGNEHDSVDSIELVRNEKKISNSPMMLATPLSTNRIHQKRAASRSGKRGAETSRFKQSEESFLSIDPSDHLFSDKGSPISSLHSGDSSSPKPGILFTASQSPILHDPKGLQTGDKVDSDSDCDLNDSICTTESNNQRRVRWNLGSNDSHLQEIPANVSLGEKAHFKMQPLQVRKSNAGNSVESDGGSFPDPFEKYRTVERRKLKGVYDWMVSRDDAADSSITKQMGGILFSMAMRQTIDCVVRRVLESNGQAVQKPQLQDGCLQGATLVLCRTKEDTEQFASALREGTAASVLNHACLQSTDRTGSRTATKCATFDVVLSTFDAIISKDVAITLNDDGHVVRKAERQDGWLSSRSSSHDEESPLRLEKLSVLHMLDWERIVFVDILGRGSYTAKYGTFRSKAATALNSASRFIFFPPSQATKKQWEALSKSDRRSFQSVSAVLRLPDAGGDESSIFRNSVDLKNARKAGR